MDYNDRESIKYYIDRLRDTLSHAEEAYKQDDIEKLALTTDTLKRLANGLNEHSYTVLGKY